ncbi:TetR family transcriptional regulator [Gelidibacter pelagius]|uniref:TetR family transcriptional regulator n=1 Tax=Gelidibacter pelagius TaxID=2819985 RepID=A0ABS3SRW0_9FLAO|nr:TetR family transcriptional regulator [Gelidibacter pelagius]MBO3097672.1 TetR family transcriptional regulator [Gelidibacter pelagius]
MTKTERILKAALQLIVERGLERTPMSKIAFAMGILYFSPAYTFLVVGI